MASITQGPPDTRPASTKRKANLQVWERQLKSYDATAKALEEARELIRTLTPKAEHLSSEIPALEQRVRDADQDEYPGLYAAWKSAEKGLRGTLDTLEESRRLESERAKQMQHLTEQMNKFATENFLAPSAEKFPTQFAAASGVLSVLTAGAVSLAGALARLVGLAPALKAVILLGVGGVVLGLLFHVPPLWVHFQDWRTAERGVADAKVPVADVAHSKAVFRLQFWLFGLQAVIWLAVTASLSVLVYRA